VPFSRSVYEDLYGSFIVPDSCSMFLTCQDPQTFPIIDSLPSYGRGCELPGGRHNSVIHGENLSDVVITGDISQQADPVVY
jgi:hypothetical protein